MYRRDLLKIIRQIEKLITSKYLKSPFEYAKVGSVLDTIEYNIEFGEYNADAIDVLIEAYKNYIQIMYPLIYRDESLIQLIDKLSKAIRKNKK